MDELPILIEIKNLAQDVNAEIVVEPEEGEYVTSSGVVGSGGNTWDRSIETVTDWVITKPAVKIPDTKKRNTARTRLKQIYNSDNWYSAKYAAARVLRGYNTEVSPYFVIVSALGTLGDRLFGRGRYEEGRYFLGTTKLSDTERREIRSKAVQDLIHLNRLDTKPAFYGDSPTYLPGLLLNEAFNRLHDRRLVREIGQELGYSRLGIWKERHPILTGIMIGGAASALVYSLASYLGR